MTHSKSALGPTLLATLSTPQLVPALENYRRYLHLEPGDVELVTPALAGFWGQPQLAGNAMALLHNAVGEPCLRLVEQPGVAPRAPLKDVGWLALEILVADVDTLVAGLQDSAFSILRPVADLELSDKIRACQVAGPCGEVMYLTQIKGDVPPFDLPRARCPVDRLFIPVLAAQSRVQALAFYEQFPATKGLCFDTKITVINQAWGWPLERQHPVATLSLQGQSLIEIDELPLAKVAQPGEHLPANVASVSFLVDDLDALQLDWRSKPRALDASPYCGRRAALVVGAAGEWIELIER